METYRLKSTLLENDKEYVIQTTNDTNVGTVQSVILVDGLATETVACPHPQEIKAEEVMSLVKLAHEEQKHEIETLLDAYRKAFSEKDPDMTYHLGTAFFYKRLYREACELFQAVVDLNPEHHQACNYLGMAQLVLNMIQEAIDSCRKAVKMRPAYADYRSSLGEAYLASGAGREAAKEFEEAIRINLYYGDAYFNLGLAYVQQILALENKQAAADLPAKAANCLKKAALIYAEYDQGLLEQGLSALRVADWGRALATLLKVREAKKEKHRREFAAFHMRFLLHSEWVSEEAITHRIRFLESEIKKNPTYVDLYAESGRCLLEYARVSWQKGIERYRKCLQMNPSLADVKGILASVEREYQSIKSVLNGIAHRG